MKNKFWLLLGIAQLFIGILNLTQDDKISLFFSILLISQSLINFEKWFTNI